MLSKLLMPMLLGSAMVYATETVVPPTNPVPGSSEVKELKQVVKEDREKLKNDRKALREARKHRKELKKAQESASVPEVK